MNSLTHVFDASNVYGSSLVEQKALRGNAVGGKMDTQLVKGASLPPQNLDDCEPELREVNRCPFRGGDERINVSRK